MNLRLTILGILFLISITLFLFIGFLPYEFIDSSDEQELQNIKNDQSYKISEIEKLKEEKNELYQEKEKKEEKNEGIRQSISDQHLDVDFPSIITTLERESEKHELELNIDYSADIEDISNHVRGKKIDIILKGDYSSLTSFYNTISDIDLFKITEINLIQEDEYILSESNIMVKYLTEEELYD